MVPILSFLLYKSSAEHFWVIALTEKIALLFHTKLYFIRKLLFFFFRRIGLSLLCRSIYQQINTNSQRILLSVAAQKQASMKNYERCLPPPQSYDQPPPHL